jgi:hypothetical protein
VARADLLKVYRPIEYKVAESAATLGRTFDFAYSHEVLDLLPGRRHQGGPEAGQHPYRGHGLP